MRKLMLLAVTALVVGLAAPAPVSAQSEDRCKEEQEGQDKGKNYRTVIGPDGHTRSRCPSGPVRA